VAARDGDGWVECGCGTTHWGRHGAAGVVIIHPSEPQVLMQLRAPWTQGGQVWGFPGGARDSHETALEAALRELHEEMGVAHDALHILHEQMWADHGDWGYHTVIARARYDLDWESNNEAVDVAWIELDEVAGLDLHPGVRASWDDVRAVLDVLLAP
jgi:8-oxo-dGTP diphosphatase